MKNLIYFFSLTVISSGVLLAIPTSAGAQNTYGWSASYRVTGGSLVAPLNAVLSSASRGPFSSQSACYADATNFPLQWVQQNHAGSSITLDQTQGAFGFYCSCNVIIGAQDSQCPGFTGATGGSNTGTGGGGGNTNTGGGGGNTNTGGGGANTGTGGNVTTLYNPLSSGTNLQSFLRAILAVVIQIGTIVIVLALVYVGFLFATSSVNPENKEKAKSALLWTVIGALILLGAQAIASGIEATVRALSGP